MPCHSVTGQALWARAEVLNQERGSINPPVEAVASGEWTDTDRTGIACILFLVCVLVYTYSLLFVCLCKYVSMYELHSALYTRSLYGRAKGEARRDGQEQVRIHPEGDKETNAMTKEAIALILYYIMHSLTP